MRFHAQKTRFWKGLLLGGAPLAALLVAGKFLNTTPPTNRAATAPDAAPELRTRVYARLIEPVLAAARAVAAAQKTWGRSWRLAERADATDNGAERRLHVEVPVLVFTDDLTISLHAQGDDRTRVNVESHSRVGQGDFGENRRHIVQFLRALDEELNA